MERFPGIEVEKLPADSQSHSLFPGLFRFFCAFLFGTSFPLHAHYRYTQTALQYVCVPTVQSALSTGFPGQKTCCGSCRHHNNCYRQPGRGERKLTEKIFRSIDFLQVEIPCGGHRRQLRVLDHRSPRRDFLLGLSLTGRRRPGLVQLLLQLRLELLQQGPGVQLHKGPTEQHRHDVNRASVREEGVVDTYGQVRSGIAMQKSAQIWTRYENPKQM